MPLLIDVFNKATHRARGTAKSSSEVSFPFNDRLVCFSSPYFYPLNGNYFKLLSVVLYINKLRSTAIVVTEIFFISFPFANSHYHTWKASW